ncbi:Reverse transcriptase domain [Trinorchestia longiramus]|nr:Reverse transcriptase domain [Trinorchestia longiramus]
MASEMILNVTEQKIAEKLSILNDRCLGILTRIYNIKKACGDSKSKPSFLSDKSLEPCIKQIVRKFPNIDSKTVSTHKETLSSVRMDIMKSLSLYYYTFVDLLDLKDHISELLTVMSALHMHACLDIGVSFELTKNYLDLITNYASLMIVLSRVDDRKPVLGLFNIAHDLVNNSGDPSFPRLGTMIMEYENPLKKLHEEFMPQAKLVTAAVNSLLQLYMRRNMTAEQWRTAQMLSLVSTPHQLLNPALTDVLPCEYLPLETLERWVIFVYWLGNLVIGQVRSVRGVKQGCTLSPLLFGLYTEELAVYLRMSGFGLKVGEEKLSCLLYADDIAVVSESEQELQMMLEIVDG